MNEHGGGQLQFMEAGKLHFGNPGSFSGASGLRWSTETKTGTILTNTAVQVFLLTIAVDQTRHVLNAAVRPETCTKNGGHNSTLFSDGRLAAYRRSRSNTNCPWRSKWKKKTFDSLTVDQFELSRRKPTFCSDLTRSENVLTPPGSFEKQIKYGRTR